MSLPILDKKGYLTILVKDNHLYANLAYSDFANDMTYLLTDVTDLSPLKFRMDDMVFNQHFWNEYFNSLEKLWKWDIVDRVWEDTFKFIPFEEEGVGLNGIKILVDDNQPFFKNIYKSLNEYSKDITLRVVDKQYMRNLLQELSGRLKYDDVLWVDLDLSRFTVSRYTKKELGRKSLFNKTEESRDYDSASIDWNNEIGIIDSINSSKLKAFLSGDSSHEESLNRWANFIAHSVDSLSDPLLEDILRAFTTVQNFSIKTEKSYLFDNLGKNTAIFLTGQISKLLPKKYLLLSLIDGFELEGDFDLYIDNDERLISYGRNLAQKEQSQEVSVLKRDILPLCTKLLIPELRSHRARNKVIYSAALTSQDFNRKDLYSINPNLEVFEIPVADNKVIIDGELKNGAYINGEQKHDFVSSSSGVIYSELVVDGRFRPVVYGPKVKDNRVKLQKWLNGDKK